MRRDPRKLLYDIATAAATLRDFCRGRSPGDYKRDVMLRSACERQLEIIGEAMTRLRDGHTDVFDQISSGPAVIGFRNRLIHGYDTVDPMIVWDVITTKVAPLAGEARELIERSAT